MCTICILLHVTIDKGLLTKKHFWKHPPAITMDFGISRREQLKIKGACRLYALSHVLIAL